MVASACAISLRAIALKLRKREQLNISGIACNGIAFPSKLNNFNCDLQIFAESEDRNISVDFKKNQGLSFTIDLTVFKF